MPYFAYMGVVQGVNVGIHSPVPAVAFRLLRGAATSATSIRVPAPPSADGAELPGGPDVGLLQDVWKWSSDPAGGGMSRRRV